LQRRPERTDDSDFKPVEYLGDAEPNDDQNVKAAPGQAVEAKWDMGADRRTGLGASRIQANLEKPQCRDVVGLTDEPHSQRAKRDSVALKC
jgi:hypothetical protein